MYNFLHLGKSQIIHLPNQDKEDPFGKHFLFKWGFAVVLNESISRKVVAGMAKVRQLTDQM